MWRNNNHNNNNNRRAWRPDDRHRRRPGSNTHSTALPNVNSNARQSTTTPSNNGLGGNSREDWGLMGDARPPTPSEGRAQYYHRAGPPEQQRTRTYDNGTALTFGPEDPIPEPMPGAAFDDQFRQVDSAIRDLQVSNLQNPMAYNPSAARSNAAYNRFRTERLDPRATPAVTFPNNEVYRIVPSRLASVEVIPHVRSLVRHSSERPGAAHPGDSTDTRFGENRPISMSQERAGTSSRYQDNDIDEYVNAQRNPNVTRESEDIEEGPIHTSRGTFYAVRPVPGYPPPLPGSNVPSRSHDIQNLSGGPQGYYYQHSTQSNVPTLVQDIDGQVYEIEGYQSGSMIDAHPPNFPSGPQNFGGYQYQGYGYGQPSTGPNVPNQSQDFGSQQSQGYGSASSNHPPQAQYGNSNVPNQAEDTPRGRTIERDAGYTRHHRRTAQRGNALFAQELDECNEADRARGEAILGGVVDSGELHTFLQFQVPIPERRAPRDEEGLVTPHALTPPRVQVTEPSPIALSENALGHMHMQSGRASAPPAPSNDMGGLCGYFVTPLYQALTAQDSLRQSPTPPAASEARSSSVDSNSENRIFGELAGTVRAPSQEGKGRKLWKKEK